MAMRCRRGAGGEHKGLSKTAITTAARTCLRDATKAPGLSGAGASKAEPGALRGLIPSTFRMGSFSP